jgi:hypothetical protein
MKYIKKYEEDRYLSDEEIESQYDNLKVTYFKVDKLYDDGGATGSIEVFFSYDNGDEDGSKSVFDNWIKYDSGPKIAFDHWFPTEINIKLKDIINKGIKEEKFRQDAERYNL